MLPRQLYTAEQCRELEALAIASGVPAYVLMSRAGAAALDLLLKIWPHATHIHVLCGAGNNGGDGLVLARLANRKQQTVTVYWLGDTEGLPAEARSAYEDAVAQGVKIVPFDATLVVQQGIIVDALLGIGVKGKVKANVASAIQWINAANLPVLSLDIPSGICANTGAVLGVAVRASRTITFLAAKRGLYTADALEYTGIIDVNDLLLPETVLQKIDHAVALLNLDAMLTALPRRPRNSHKGLFGHVLVIGGNRGMVGAALLTATAAMRSGAGLVSIATLPENVAALAGCQAEIMVHGVSNGAELETLLEKASVVIIGPGLGQDEWAEQLLQKAGACGLPLIMDADALNVLSHNQIVKPSLPQQRVLTPHPGEAARLLNVNIENIKADRFQAAEKLCKKFHATVVLKGAGTIIAGIAGSNAGSNGLSLCAYGNSGMSSGGMGDVLAGVVAGLLAQGLTATEAASLAVAVHARAADILAQEYGQRGLLAGDLIPVIRRLLNGL